MHSSSLVNKESVPRASVRNWVSELHKFLLRRTDQNGKSTPLLVRLQRLMNWSSKCACVICNPYDSRFIAPEAEAWQQVLEELKNEAVANPADLEQFGAVIEIICLREDVQASLNLKILFRSFL